MMTLTLSADQAIDRDRATAVQPGPFGGPHTNVRTALAYRHQQRSRAFSLNATTGFQHYPSLERVSAVTHSLAAGFSTTLWRHTQIHLTQRAVRSPFFTVSLPNAGADADAPAFLTDYETFRWMNTALATGIAVAQPVGRRSSVTVHYGSQTTQMVGGKFTSQTAGAAYNYRVSRYATARMGYSRRIVTRRSASVAALESRDSHSHDVDIGVDYSRPLSLSRRTTLNFHSGSSIVPANGRNHVQMSGGAALSRAFGRTWTASVQYGRHMQFVETLAAPLLSDSVSLQLQGLPLRRLQVSLSTSASIGHVGFGSGDRGHMTQLAAMRARWTINRFLLVYADSSYYRHTFGSAVDIVPGVRRNVDRPEVRVGVMTWVPLLH